MSSYSAADENYDSDGLPEPERDVRKLMRRASDVLKVKCISLKKLTRGARHEVFTLDFEEGTAAPPSSASEIATVRYLARHTDIPKTALSEIASFVAQLASLKFDQIGSLDEHGVGPLISPCFDHPKGPFRSTAEYLRSFISAESLQPPYCLIHADFDGQNMFFLEPSDGSGPKLSGLIDFEYAHTGPLYFLYDYPIFIQDMSWSKGLYAENAILRAYLVRAIYKSLPNSEARSTFTASVNEKNFVLNVLRDSFMTLKCSEKTLINSSTYYVQNLRNGIGLGELRPA
ncbi:hypothetical protein L209DRAFT_765504 [Thermothelomyces heterothallicus CBS 203.75]